MPGSLWRVLYIYSLAKAHEALHIALTYAPADQHLATSKQIPNRSEPQTSTTQYYVMMSSKWQRLEAGTIVSDNSNNGSPGYHAEAHITGLPVGK